MSGGRVCRIYFYLALKFRCGSSARERYLKNPKYNSMRRSSQVTLFNNCVIDLKQFSFETFTNQKNDSKFKKSNEKKERKVFYQNFFCKNCLSFFVWMEAILNLSELFSESKINSLELRKWVFHALFEIARLINYLFIWQTGPGMHKYVIKRRLRTFKISSNTMQ